MHYADMWVLDELWLRQLLGAWVLEKASQVAEPKNGARGGAIYWGGMEFRLGDGYQNHLETYP
jgi:hypothetical protein